MRHQELVYKLTRELYDLKDKLERIRKHTDMAYFNPDDKELIRYRIIDISNELDMSEDYAD